MTTKSKEIIKRYFAPDIFDHIKADFGFLIKKVRDSGYEYDLQIRDNYFNLYYKGNSMAKVSYHKKADHYLVSIHGKFINEGIKTRFSKFIHSDAAYLVFSLPKSQLHPLLSTQNLLSMGQKIKEVNYQEEITFEQMLMTDNVGRPDFIIIDRQVIDRVSRTRIDLLALAQKKANEYQFCVVEVKLGNNKELKGPVIDQTTGYLQRITDNFKEYKRCYETNVKQKQALGLIDRQSNINIVPGVLGLIVVGGYSGLAKESIESLRGPENIKVLHIKNVIKLEDARSIAKT